MATLEYLNEGGRPQRVDEANGLPVRLPGSLSVLSRDYLWKAVAEGRVFISADADQNDVVTGQTSFANTTPTFLLDVPAGTVAVPLFANISQAGTVAGDVVSVVIEMDKVKRHASGGTAEKIANARTTPAVNAKCVLYSTATAAAGYGINLWAAQIGQDVSPAEGAVQGPFWRPEIPYQLVGPATLLIYAYAGTTGPTIWWSIGWMEMSIDEANLIARL